MRPPSDEQMYGNPTWAEVPYAPGEAEYVYTLILVSYVIALAIQLLGARLLGIRKDTFGHFIMALWWMPFGFILMLFFI